MKKIVKHSSFSFSINLANSIEGIDSKSRIKMLNGKYANLSNYHAEDQPLSIFGPLGDQIVKCRLHILIN